MVCSKYEKINKGLSRIAKEQDFVRFVQNQVKFRTMFKALFNRLERHLIKNSNKLVIHSCSSDSSESSDYSPEMQAEGSIWSEEVVQKLIDGVHKTTKKVSQAEESSSIDGQDSGGGGDASDHTAKENI